jgi:hypothetical protein
MSDREHDLSITKQAEILKISRGSVYYLPRPVSSADLEIMRQLADAPLIDAELLFRQPGPAHNREQGSKITSSGD